MACYRQELRREQPRLRRTGAALTGTSGAYRPRLIVHVTLPVLTFLVWPGNTFTVFLMVAIVITSFRAGTTSVPAGPLAPLAAIPCEVRLPRAYPRKLCAATASRR